MITLDKERYKDEDLNSLRWAVEPNPDMAQAYESALSIYGTKTSLDDGNFFKFVKTFGAPKILQTSGVWSGFGCRVNYVRPQVTMAFNLLEDTH